MDIRLLENTDTAEAKALWKEAFGDSDRFIDWYFLNKVLPGNSVGIFDGRLVSALHLIPFEICVQGRLLKSAFIAGAATAKAMRGQGLMRVLLLEALKLLKSLGIFITYLYPFKHSFYENFGWATYSYVYNKNMITGDGNTGGDVIETEDWRLLAPLYGGMMCRFDGYVIRNRREWEWRLNEIASDGGKAALFIKNGVPAAYMLYYNGDSKAEVIETVYNEEDDLYPLLKYLIRDNQSAAYFIPDAGTQDAVPYDPEPSVPYGPEPPVPYGPETPVPYGMARVVDVQALLKFFGAEEALNHIRISDGFAEWNNTGDGIPVDIGALAKMVHRGAEGVLSADACGACGGLLKKLFSPRATCIFEQY